jgi:hypothetical protein
MLADCVLLPNDAEIVEAVEPDTSLVATVKLAWFAPAGTETAGGTCATVVLLLARVTVTASDGGAYLMVTVPVAEAGPTIEVGLRDSAVTA